MCDTCKYNGKLSAWFHVYYTDDLKYKKKLASFIDYATRSNTSQNDVTKNHCLIS